MKIRLTSLLIITLTVVQSFAQLAPTTGGPDSYGYVWRDSDNADPKAPIASWVEIANPLRSGAIRLSDNPKGFYGPISFNFEFPYFWYSRSSMYVDNNGYIIFRPNQLQSPYNTAPRGLGEDENQTDDYIAPMLTGLGVNGAGTGVYFWTNFKDSVVVTWENMSFGDEDGTATVQLILDKNDGSITYQYAAVNGTISAVCLGVEQNNEQVGPEATCFMIGLENKTGKIGVMVADDDASRVQLLHSKAAPYAIRFLAEEVESQAYELEDMSINWVNRPNTIGTFALKNSDLGKPIVQLLNNGTVTLDDNYLVKANFNRGPITIESNSALFSEPLAPNETANVTFPGVIKTDTVGIFGIRGTVQSNDGFTMNNNLTQYLNLVDSAGGKVTMDYVPGGGGPDFTWFAATNFTSGVGVFIEPPYYPAVITDVNFGNSNQGLQPTENMRINIYDDNGTDIYGLPNGTRGTLLYTKDVLPTGQNATYSTTTIDELVQINSGGVYISTMQGGPNAYYHTGSAGGVVSFNTYKVFGRENFLPFQDKESLDLAIGMSIATGDPSIAPDLSVSAIISPLNSNTNIDSVELTFELHNQGAVDITDPFGVSFFVDLREPISEFIDVDIAAGEKIEITLSKKSARPPAPKTTYSRLCAYVFLDNDINPSNDIFCSVGQFNVNGIENLQNILGHIAFPNPVNDFVTFSFSLETPEASTITVFDTQGRLIKSVDFSANYGSHSAKLDMSNVGVGMYYYRLKTASGSFATGKLIKE
ncbi:MAG: hypothetical protein ACJAZ3_001532 [Sphingobacteriales bacterium]|jgi:hypothetical protein